MDGSRFFDEDGMRELSKSANFNNLKGFYSGDLVTNRMNAIRESINYIRRNWEKYPDFMNIMEGMLCGFGFDSATDSGCALSAASLFKERDWEHVEDYSLIVLYTDTKFYSKVFKICSNIFRDDESVESRNLIQSAVFLVELLNIELHNYCINNPNKKNYTGNVYRGMSISNTDVEKVKELLDLPLNNRYISIPLSLTSSSKDKEISLDFIRKNSAVGKVGLLYQIKVLNLEDCYLNLYWKYFPKSVVSTICAVDISELSVVPKEQEVLLRGAFMQILNVRPYDDVECEVWLVDAVMINSSRDHIVTAHLGEQDADARAFFGTMVGITRAKYCKEYCEKHELHEDVQKYSELIQELTSKFDKLNEKLSNSNNQAY